MRNNIWLIPVLLSLLVVYPPSISAQVFVTIPNIDHLIVAGIGESETVDPAWAYDTASAELIFNVYETLTSFNYEKVDEFLPCLATEWTTEYISETSPEGLTWLQRHTFKTRDGVKFHNDMTLTTEDVEYSFERWMVQDRSGGPSLLIYEPLLGVYYANLSDPNWHLKIENTIQHNNTHVWFNLVTPCAPFMQILSQSWSSIVNKKFVVEHGDWPANETAGKWFWPGGNWTQYHDPPVSPLDTGGDWVCGTGPYILDYWTRGVEWSVVKFDDYWGGWPAEECSSFVSRATMKTVWDWSTRKAMFLNGTADIVFVPRQNIWELEGQPGVRSIKNLSLLSCSAMLFNFNISTTSLNIGSGQLDGNGISPDFFSDIDVRKGFAYSVNYTQYLEQVFGPYTDEVTRPATPVIEGLPYHNPDQAKYRLDLTKAEQHLKAAWGGQVWDIGFNLTIAHALHNCGSKGWELAMMLKTNIESLNPKFRLNTLGLTWPEWMEQLLYHELTIIEIGWLFDYPDPHNFVWPFMHTEGYFAFFQSYSNATVDALVEEGLATMNTSRRREVYYALQSIYHIEAPSVPLSQPLGRHWERDWVQGWYYNPAYPGVYVYHLWKGLDGDVDGDGKVGILDAGVISGHWYPGQMIGPLGYNRKADISPILAPDGQVNILDAAVINAHWTEEAA